MVDGPVGGRAKVRKNLRRSRGRRRRQTPRQKKHCQCDTQGDARSSEHMASNDHCRQLTQRSRSGMPWVGRRVRQAWPKSRILPFSVFYRGPRQDSNLRTRFRYPKRRRNDGAGQNPTGSFPQVSVPMTNVDGSNRIRVVPEL
jgi:hypothetical protein